MLQIIIYVHTNNKFEYLYYVNKKIRRKSNKMLLKTSSHLQFADKTTIRKNSKNKCINICLPLIM